MELGPIQKAWIAALRAHPEKQMKGALGMKYPDRSYSACCLGEGGLIAGVCEWTDKGYLTVIGDDNFSFLGNGTFKALGLRSMSGIKDNSCKSLSILNDTGSTWTEIADMLESNPEDWFDKSV